jgi:O-antigen/teichoic acid export membrane protein
MRRYILATVQTAFGRLPGRSFVNTGIYTLAHGLPQAINFFLLPVYTRYLTPGEFGIFSFTSAILVFLPIFGSLSLHTYLLRHYRTAKDDAARQTLVGTVSVTLIFLTTCAVALGFLVLPPVFDALEISVDFHPYMKLALLIGAIDVIAIIPQCYFRITENAKAFFGLISVQVFMVAGTTLYLLVIEDFGLLSRYYGLLSTNSVLLLFYIALIWRVSRFTFSPKLLGDGLKYCFPLAISALLIGGLTVTDRFVLERYSSLQELGIYAIALTVSGSIGLLVISMYKAFEPQFYAQEDGHALNEYAAKVKQVILIVVLVAATPLIAGIREILALLVTPEFYRAATVISILVGAEMVRGLGIPVVIHLLAVNKTRFQPLIAGLSGAVMIVASLLLIPRWGAVGAAMAALIGAAAHLFGTLIYSQTKSDVNWKISSDLGMAALVLGTGFAIQTLNFEGTAIGGTIKVSLALSAVALFGYFWTKFGAPKKYSASVGTSPD